MAETEALASVDMASWSAAKIERAIRAEIGPHEKMELAIPYLARLFAGLWEARQLNLQRIDDLRDDNRKLRARVAALEGSDGSAT